MTFIIRIKIITVNDTYCVIQLQTEFKSQSTSRVAFQYPVLLHFHTDSRWNLGCFTRIQYNIRRCKEIISCTSGCCPYRKRNFLISVLYFFIIRCRECIFPVLCKLLRTYFMKFCNSFHAASCLFVCSCSLIITMQNDFAFTKCRRNIYHTLIG